MRRKLLDALRSIFKIRALEKLLVQLTKNKLFGSPITKLPPNHYQYSKGSYRKANRNGIYYQLDLSDTVDWYIYYGFKEESRQAFYKLMLTGDHIVDIGANVGDVSLNAAKICGENGKVHAFEPDPINYQRLQNNLRLNHFTNIQTHQLGLGDNVGTFVMRRVSDGNQGMNRIVNHPPGGKATIEIEVTTLDNFFEKNGIERVDLIKIDVEGFEYKVLKGAEKTLNRFQPVLFIELDDQNLSEQGSSAKELVQFLEEKGYELTHAEKNKKVTSETDFKNCHYDIVGKHTR